MQDLFGFLLLGAIFLLLMGLISPTKGLFWYKGSKSRKKVGLFYGLVIILSFFGFGIFSPDGKSKSIDQTELKDIVDSYTIINEEKYETNNKAQLVEYAVYTDSIYTEDAIKNVLLEIYKKNKNKDLFENFDSPTVFASYLYTSKELANNKSAWIGMLTMNPLEAKPRLSYDKKKLNSLNGLNDTFKSRDEIALDNLNNYLSTRNLELCNFYKYLLDMELECIHKADEKYPNFGINHTEYADKLMNEERKALMKKHNLADSIFVQVSLFGMNYCK